GHAYANGHVARVCERVGAFCVVDSDAHEPGDFLDDAGALMVAEASGLPESMVRDALDVNPLKVLERAGVRNLSK
ncbi:MAG: PHP domain-containing protein, partial [Planctomycetota bacterium]